MDLQAQVFQSVRACLARHESQLGEAALLAAVSGGTDSMVLLRVLAGLRDEGALSGPLLCGHVDHGLQPDRQDAERLVKELCTQLDVPLLVGRLEGCPPDEDSLREARYRALSEMARSEGARAVLCGHHADDDLETALFRLLRGTGPRGLAGIPECRSLEPGIVLLRPLLQLRRSTLETLRDQLGLAVYEDPSNRDTAYTRNEIRHEIIPALRDKLGSGLDISMFALLRSARATTAILESQAGRMLREQGRFPQPWRAELRVGPEHDQEGPFLEEALCQLHARLDPAGERPAWSWVERVVALLQADAGQRVSGNSPILCERTREGLLCLDPEQAGSPPDEALVLPAEGRVPFGDTGYAIDVLTHPAAPLSPSPEQAGPGRALIDPRALAQPFSLRTRRSGDQFWPLGQAGPVELRRFMQARHVPRFDRDRLPLVLDASGQIVWVPGVEIAEPAKVDLGSGACVELRILGS